MKDRELVELTGGCRQLYEQARTQLKYRNLERAVVACRELNERFPRFAEGWYLGSQIATRLGNLEKGLEFAGQAIALAPGNELYSVHKANCLVYLRRYGEAGALARSVLDRDPDDPPVLAGLGTVFTGCGRHAEALKCYEKAIRNEADNPMFHYNLAATQRFLGQLDEAEASYNATIRLNPHEYEAYLMRSELCRCTREKNHVEELETRLSQGVQHWRGEVQLCYALAKEYEDLEEYDKSFAMLKRGADLRRAHSEYDARRDTKTLEWIAQTFGADRFRGTPQGFPTSEPIFIVGLPRTGTTLVERILSSHSAVVSAGELNNFAIEMVGLVQKAARRELSREETIERSVAIDFCDLGRRYIESTRPQTGGTPHFIDKLPANYLYCGLIRLALPEAKIIALVRHPMDTCYAIYKTLFKAAYPFSYDLEELGRYYVAYRKLMDHWRTVLPGGICEISYENLVADQEGESRRLLEYCGLDWEPRVLDFHLNPEPALTASTVQVRQPIYSSSVGKWRNLARQLEPLEKILVQAGIRVE